MHAAPSPAEPLLAEPTLPETSPDSRPPHAPFRTPATHAGLTTENGRGGHRVATHLLVALTVLGFAVRIALSAVSLGSNDWATWRWFAALTICTGPSAYTLEPTLNHPPIPVLWSCASLLLCAVSGINFPFLFRLPAIAADLGSCVLLGNLWRKRYDGQLSGNEDPSLGVGPDGQIPDESVWGDRSSTGRGALIGWAASAAMAWNLDALLVGSYHCNTDNVCAFLALLSAYQLAHRHNALRGGLALAAAINVKLVPVLLVPALLVAAATGCGGWRRGGGRFLLGLSAGLPPFLLMFGLVPSAFARNALAYSPMPGEWGLMLLAMDARATPLLAAKAAALAAWYSAHGKHVVLAAAGLLALIAFVRPRRWDAYQSAAMTMALFLLLTPGFGLQYTVYAVPLMLAVDLRRGSAYGLVAGLYLLATYAGKWDGRLPLESMFNGGAPNPLPPPIGLVAWVLLGAFVWRTLGRPGRTRSASQAEQVNRPDGGASARAIARSAPNEPRP